MKRYQVRFGNREGVMTEEAYERVMKSRTELYNTAISLGWSEEEARRFLPEIIRVEESSVKI